MDRRVVVPFTERLVRVSASVLRAIGEPAAAEGTQIRSAAFAVDVKNGCNGVEAALILAAAVLAFPARWGHRFLGLLAAAAEPVLRLFERPPATRLYAEGRRVVVDRADFASRSDRPSLPADDLTVNVVLLLGLSATRRKLLGDRGLLRLLAALVLLAGTHVAALAVSVKALYATGLGEWSAAHYGVVSRNLWAGAAHFGRLAGCWGAAFLLWWGIVRPGVSGAGARPGRPAPRPAGRRASRPRGRA